MKKLFFFLAIICVKNSDAQTYHPLTDSGVVWNVENASCAFGFPLFCDVGGEKFVLAGDTEIDAVQYAIVKLQELYTYSYKWTTPLTFISGNYFNLPSFEIGLLRDDSDKRVWFRPLHGVDIGGCGTLVTLTDSDNLLYDFNLEIGDTISYSRFDKLILTSIDSVQLADKEWRKRFSFTGYDNAESQQWIEGVGSTNGLFGPYSSVIDCGTSLTCYRKNSQLLYEAEGPFETSCDSAIISGISGIAAPVFQFLAFPNIYGNFIEVNFSSQEYPFAELKITDEMGRILHEEKMQSHQPIQISTSGFKGNHLLFCFLTERNLQLAQKEILLLR